jgi:hypothetical protein
VHSRQKLLKTHAPYAELLRVLHLRSGAQKVMQAKSNSGMLQHLGHLLICCLYMMATQKF